MTVLLDPPQLPAIRHSFINKIDNYGMRSGIVKIVPPKEWYVSISSPSCLVIVLNHTYV